MEDPKSHDSPSTSQTPRRADGVVLVYIQRPENQESQGNDVSFSSKGSRLETKKRLTF